MLRSGRLRHYGSSWYGNRSGGKCPTLVELGRGIHPYIWHVDAGLCAVGYHITSWQVHASTERSPISPLPPPCRLPWPRPQAAARRASDLSSSSSSSISVDVVLLQRKLDKRGVELLMMQQEVQELQQRLKQQKYRAEDSEAAAAAYRCVCMCVSVV